MRAQQSKFLESINSNADDDVDDTKSGQDLCDSRVKNNSEELAQVICSLCHSQSSSSPVSFLVLLQVASCLRFYSIFLILILFGHFVSIK